MAQFDYATYSAQQATKKANNAVSGNKTHFVNEFLKRDGDTIIVRFPYTSMNDVVYTTTHSVTFPGDKYNKRVDCAGDSCPLCKQGVKKETRFFAKALVYVPNASGGVDIIPAIWDRPSAFADIDLKEKMEECKEDDIGTVADNLIKIKRNGEGTDTRYTLNIVHNKTIYNPEVYKADFSLLDSINPAKILTRTVDKYLDAVNGTVEVEPTMETPLNSAETPAMTPNTQSVVEEPVVETPRTAVTYDFGRRTVAAGDSRSSVTGETPVARPTRYYNPGE